MTIVEWLVDEAGNIALHLDGVKMPPPFASDADVRRVPTKKLRAAVLAALDEAMRLGAKHGPCNRDAELTRALTGDGRTPGCAGYWSNRDGTAVVRRMDGREVPVVEGIRRPKCLSGDIGNALDRAFRVGQRYGYQPVVTP